VRKIAKVITIEVRRDVSELHTVLRDILGDKASELSDEITPDKEVDGVGLVRRMFELGAEPKKVRDLLGIAWGLAQDDVQKVMEVARKPEVEEDAEIRIGRDDDSEEGDTEEPDISSLLGSGVFEEMDETLD